MVLSPEEALEKLLEVVDDVTDWLNYEAKLEDLENAIKALNRARMTYLVAKERARRARLASEAAL